MINIGWFVEKKYPPLELLCETPDTLDLVKSSNAAYRHCPATTKYCANTFIVRSPYSMEISFKDGKFDVISSSFNKNLLGDIFKPEPVNYWRNPNSPLFQIDIYQGFVADEEVWVEVSMPSFDSKSRKLPGRIIPGEFDIYSWQRVLSYSFEWMDTSQNFVIDKGDPLYYIRFKSKKPGETFKFIRIDQSEELQHAVERCTNSKLYFVNKAWNLMKFNRKLRPKKFVK